jgi:hypothetical protein
MANTIFTLVKQGDSYKILYSAKNFKSGLADVKAIPYDPTGVAQVQVTFTEIASTGIYYYVWDSTGKAIGDWTFIINSNSQSSPAFTRIQVVDISTNLGTPFSTIDSNIDTILASINNGTYGLSAIKTELDTDHNTINNINGIVSNLSGQIGSINTESDSILSILNNVVYGSSAIQSLISSVNSTLVSGVASIKGNGNWTPNANLANIYYNSQGGGVAL